MKIYNAKINFKVKETDEKNHSISSARLLFRIQEKYTSFKASHIW